MAVRGRLNCHSPAGRRVEPSQAAAPAPVGQTEVTTMAGQECVVVLMVALIAASFSLDLHGYLTARRRRRPRHGRKRRH